MKKIEQRLSEIKSKQCQRRHALNSNAMVFFRGDGESVRIDGGPGSGNHGHAGVPGKRGGSAPGNMNRKVVSGQDVFKTYTGKRDIKSIMKAQGYDGLPKVVGIFDFYVATKDSQFMSQRSYTASSKKVLESYRKQLYNGEWYVECTTGGAEYGRGMYVASDYEGKLTDGIRAEMSHYEAVGRNRAFKELNINMSKSELNSLRKAMQQRVSKLDPSGEKKLDLTDGELVSLAKHRFLLAFQNLTPAYSKKFKSACEKFDELNLPKNKTGSLSTFYFNTCQKYGLDDAKSAKLCTYTESITLDKSAKIADYDTLAKQHWSDYYAYFSERKKTNFQAAGPTMQQFLQEKKAGTKFDKLEEKYPKESKQYLDILHQSEKEAKDFYCNHDMGAYAALQGYDAIRANGHGESGSYTVILNRTKAIILDGKDYKMDAADNEIITFVEQGDGFFNAVCNGRVIGFVYDAAQVDNDDTANDRREQT